MDGCKLAKSYVEERDDKREREENGHIPYRWLKPAFEPLLVGPERVRRLPAARCRRKAGVWATYAASRPAALLILPLAPLGGTKDLGG